MTPLDLLRTALDAGEGDALAWFWDEVARIGTPLVERLEGSRCRVTFLWQGDGDTCHVAVIQDWGADGVREHQMTRLPGTDVWYTARVFPADTRTTYQLSPSTSPDPAAPAPYCLDPLNPRTFTVYRAEQGQDIAFSLLELPDAPAQPWKQAHAAPGAVTLHRVPVDGRRVWVYTPPLQQDTPYPLLVVFDGRQYLSVMELPAILDYLIQTGRIPPVMALLLDNPHRAELMLDPAFADYVAHAVLPWARAAYPVTTNPTRTVAVGSSSGGVMAAYLGLRYPHLFGAVLSQTGWFRWKPNDEAEFGWLARQFAAQPRAPLCFYLDVGCLETAKMRDGGPTQLEANRAMRDTLLARGYPVHYVEVSGGHDYSSLQNPLLEALAFLLGEQSGAL